MNNYEIPPLILCLPPSVRRSGGFLTVRLGPYGQALTKAAPDSRIVTPVVLLRLSLQRYRNTTKDASIHTTHEDRLVDINGLRKLDPFIDEGVLGGSIRSDI
jgi:hypothetical protein